MKTVDEIAVNSTGWIAGMITCRTLSGIILIEASQFSVKEASPD